MDRTTLRRAAAGLSVLGLMMTGSALMMPVTAAHAANEQPGGSSLYTASQSTPGTFVDSNQDCNGTIPTPGSKSRDKFITSDVSNFDPVHGGTVSYEFSYPGTPKTNGDAFAIRDCVAVYGPTSGLAQAISGHTVTFEAPETTPSGATGSGNIDEVVPGNEPLFKDNTKTVLTQVEAQGVDHGSYFDFTVAIPGPIAPGSIVCNYAKDIGGIDLKNNPFPDTDASEPGNGNRKAGACFRVPGGSLTVSKVLSNNTDTHPFAITVTCGTNAPIPLSLHGGESVTLDGLPVGTCTVTETNSRGATVTYLASSLQTDGTVTITNGGTATETVTNTGPTTPPTGGSLTVTKSVVNSSTTDKFTITVNCGDDVLEGTLSLSNGQSATLTDLPVGTCTVTETNSKGATVTYLASTNQTNGDVTITNGGTATETVTNTYPVTGSLTVVKSVVNSSTDEEFSIDVTCGESATQHLELANGESVTLTGLAPETTCIVHEVDGQGATITYSDGANNGHVTIVGNQTVTETVTNTFPSTPPPVCTVNCTPVVPNVPTPSVTVVKANDAGGNAFAKSNVAKGAGDSVDFLATITNTSSETETITSITDSYGTVVNSPECASLIGTSLASGASTTCGFTIANYAPPAGSSLTNTVAVLVTDVNNKTANASDTSTVTTPAAAVLPEVATTVPPTTTTTVPPTTTTLPTAVLPLTGSRTLPFTGTNARLLLLAGLGLILLGLGLMVGTWRMPEQTDR